MEAKYYVVVRPRTNETHPIHKEGCPFLADDDKSIYLGRFRSGKDALNEGKQHFLNSIRCPFCSKETETARGNPVRYKEEPASIITASAVVQLPVFYHNSLLCCVN